MGVIWNEISTNAFGGTELMGRALEKHISKDLLDKFQIFPSRVTQELDKTKHRILWCHDLPGDPMYEHLEKDGWEKFHRLVFVSNWQQQAFINHYKLPWSKCVVLQNAIEPIGTTTKTDDIINICYTPTPHRGLAILVPVFEKLAEKWGDKIHLHVFSSFQMYGWAERDKEFDKLFERINKSKNMTYYGYIPNSEVREKLKTFHIFAYPSIWPETSCLALMEAMSAGLVCVHPNYAGLPETSANWTLMYPWHESANNHAGVFYKTLDDTIEFVSSGQSQTDGRLTGQVNYAGTFYNWELRKIQWEYFLNGLQQEAVEIPTGPIFTYRTS